MHTHAIDMLLDIAGWCKVSFCQRIVLWFLTVGLILDKSFELIQVSECVKSSACSEYIDAVQWFYVAMVDNVYECNTIKRSKNNFQTNQSLGEFVLLIDPPAVEEIDQDHQNWSNPEYNIGWKIDFSSHVISKNNLF